MGSQAFFRFLFGLFLVGSFLGVSDAYKFYVGGKDGWVWNPSENFNHWAERNRFQVNDTLYFKYKKGSNSVLVVQKDDYYTCNTRNPLQSMTDGDSIFKFDRSGPFFFISGDANNCNKGQRLIVVVLSENHKKQHSPPPRQSPSPVVSPSAATNPPPTLPPPPPPAPQPQPPVHPPPQPQPPVQPPSSDKGSVPAPAPSKSGSHRDFSVSVGLVLGAVMLGTFAGMV